MIKEGGEWKTVDWPQALDFVARGLRRSTRRHGGAALGTVVSPHSTLEEMALAARLTRALGSDNVDFRLRQSDFRGDGQGAGLPWLGMPIADLDTLDRVLVIGSFLRKDHPLAAQRLRHAARKGAEVSLLHSVADDSADPPRAFVRRRAVAAAARAGGDRRRRGEGRGQAGSRGARRHRARRRRRGDRREPPRRQAQGDPARQLRGAASGSLAALRAGAGARGNRRREARLPHARPRTASAATSPMRCRRPRTG